MIPFECCAIWPGTHDSHAPFSSHPYFYVASAYSCGDPFSASCQSTLPYTLSACFFGVRGSVARATSFASLAHTRRSGCWTGPSAPGWCNGSVSVVTFGAHSRADPSIFNRLPNDTWLRRVFATFLILNSHPSKAVIPCVSSTFRPIHSSWLCLLWKVFASCHYRSTGAIQSFRHNRYSYA